MASGLPLVARRVRAKNFKMAGVLKDAGGKVLGPHRDSRAKIYKMAGTEGWAPRVHTGHLRAAHGILGVWEMIRAGGEGERVASRCWRLDEVMREMSSRWWSDEGGSSRGSDEVGGPHEGVVKAGASSRFSAGK